MTGFPIRGVGGRSNPSELIGLLKGVDGVRSEGSRW